MSISLPAFAANVSDFVYAVLPPLGGDTSSLTLACAGRERCSSGYRVDRASYPCLALEFVAEGEGELVLQGRRHRLRPGHVFTYGPGVRHRIESDERRPMTKYFVDFFGRGASSLCRDADIAPPSLVRAAEVEPLRFLFEELIREARKSGPLAHTLAAGYLRLILLKTLERATAPAAESGRAFETFQRAVRLVETNHASLHSLEDLARAAKVDAAHLCRLYARFRHDSPARHLLRRKLDTAARLLSTEPVLIKEAAAAAGFSDPLHFSRVFRRIFGCSPSDFQARRRGGPPRPSK